MTETFTVRQDDKPDISFTGTMISEVSSWSSNNDTRWTELRLYKTAGGTYICEKIGQTRWQNENTHYSAAVCENHEEIKTFFGYGWLSKELYEDADIDATITIE